MDKKSTNYTKQAIPQFMHQSRTSSLIGYFKTNNRSIITLFQGEVKYLNLANYHFLKALDMFRFIKYVFINSWFPNWCDFLKTPRNQVKS